MRTNFSSLCFVGQGQGHADHVCIVNEVIQLDKLGIQLFLLLLRQVLVVEVAQLLQAKALQAVGSKLGEMPSAGCKSVCMSSVALDRAAGTLPPKSSDAMGHRRTPTVEPPSRPSLTVKKLMMSCTRLLHQCFPAIQSPRNLADSAYDLLPAPALSGALGCSLFRCLSLLRHATVCKPQGHRTPSGSPEASGSALQPVLTLSPHEPLIVSCPGLMHTVPPCCDTYLAEPPASASPQLIRTHSELQGAAAGLLGIPVHLTLN